MASYQTHVQGTAGADALSGDARDDLVEGGTGRDTLTGGGGYDGFVFALQAPATDSLPSAPDLVTDFETGDLLVLPSVNGVNGKVLLFNAEALDFDSTADSGIVQIGTFANDGLADIYWRHDLDAQRLEVWVDGNDDGRFNASDLLIHLDTSVTGKYAIGFTDFADVLAAWRGSSAADQFQGTAGDDVAYAQAGNDTLLGGTGNDAFYGGTGDDQLAGQDGADHLYGGTGADTLFGGIGNDHLYADGQDTPNSAGQDAGGTFNLLDGGLGDDAVTGGFGDDDLFGDDGSDTLSGGAGRDTLHGGAGADQMFGGAGDDVYWVDSLADVTSESGEPGGGNDTIISSVTRTLGQAEEILLLTGTDALAGFGNALANTIHGNAAANTIDGGAGADAMFGGAGDDTYHVDSLDDSVWELAAQDGSDTVVASVDFVLLDHLENLTLTGLAVLGRGNELANLIVGNAQGNALDGGAGADTMRGGLGNDSYAVDDLLDVVDETGGDGVDMVSSRVSFVLGGGLEHLVLVGTGNMDGTGNELGNYIGGNTAANVIDGGAGGDTMEGGLGDDTYHVNAYNDEVYEVASGGVDRVIATISYQLWQNVENLVIAGSRGKYGRGNALDNRIDGSVGSDTLEGNGGADTLAGGLGNDAYNIDAHDTVIEASGGGTDTVYVGFSYTLGAHVENASFYTTGGVGIRGTGNALANMIQGSAGNDVIDGGSGADRLYGRMGNDTVYGGNDNDRLEGYDGNDFLWGGSGNDSLVGGAHKDLLEGGTGADSMAGGDGDDTYYVDNTGDATIEKTSTSAGGIDTVISSVSRSLAGQYVENLTLTGSKALAATGNSLNNRIHGNVGNNAIDGGTGADTMTGGTGNDSYRVDNLRDVVKEASGGGTDTVFAGVDFTLGAYVEHLMLAGKGHLAGTGNTLANVIAGNAGNNRLAGGGGRDSLAGGAGNDTYLADADDVITETRTGGTDTVISTVSRTLANYLEHLTFQGTAGYKGTGNALANTITGSSGADVLDGAGGNDRVAGLGGKDLLTGGAGADLFVFTKASDTGKAAFDVITDFARGSDRIDLQAIHAPIGAGVAVALKYVGDGPFVADMPGQVRWDYDARTGSVMVYGSTDADTAVEFAIQVRGVTSLSEGDFLL